MSYQLVPTPHFVKQLSKLDKFVQRRVVSYLEKTDLLQNPRKFGKALTNDRSGQWRYRVGDYRIIVEIQEEEVTILALEVGHRRRVYR